jgi:apolipoprotein N-acyltransferase
MTRLDLARALVRPLGGYAVIVAVLVLAFAVPVLAASGKDTTGAVAALAAVCGLYGHIYRERRIERTPPTE